MKNKTYTQPIISIRDTSQIVMQSGSETPQVPLTDDKIQANQVESKQSSPFSSFWEEDED